MGGAEDTHKRRHADTGWNRFTTGVPIVIALLGLLVTGVISFTTLDLTVKSHASGLKQIRSSHSNDVERIQSVQELFRPRIRALENTQRQLKTKLEAIHEEQRQNRVRQAAGRKEVLDAIKDLGRRVDRGRQ